MQRALIGLAMVIVVAATVAVTADTFDYQNRSLYGRSGDQGGYVNGYAYCNDYNYGGGDRSVSGYTRIYGRVGGVYVSESEYYDDQCPGTLGHSLSVNGLTMTVECPQGNVYRQRGNGHGQTSYPSQKKPVNTQDQYDREWTYDGNLCEATATHAGLGLSETYSYGYYNSNDRRTHNNN